MRLFILACGLGFAAPLMAQAAVTSPAPDRVAVTVYRDTDRGLEPINPDWLGGYALVSEIRHVRLPAGTSEVRFEGVTSGIVPQSAIITGMGEAVLEKKPRRSAAFARRLARRVARRAADPAANRPGNRRCEGAGCRRPRNGRGCRHSDR